MTSTNKQRNLNVNPLSDFDIFYTEVKVLTFHLVNETSTSENGSQIETILSEKFPPKSVKKMGGLSMIFERKFGFQRIFKI